MLRGKQVQYNSKGLTPDTLEDFLRTWTAEMQPTFGNDFQITKESTIGNICTASSLVAMDYEQELLFRDKNMNPNTAEDEYQDALYKLIGLERTYATYTVVQRTVEGTPNTVAEKGSILFRNKSTQDQFKLNDDCQIGENGKGVGSFTAEELGAIDLPDEALCEIITAPTNIVGVYYSSGNQIEVGQDYQDNAQFRYEWEQTQSLANSDTEGGIKKYLLPYAIDKSAKNINVRQNRHSQKYEDVPLHSMNIVINSAYDDETIADVIFKHLKDGIGLVGDIEIEVEDSEGSKEVIAFSRADLVTVYFKVSVQLIDNVYLTQVQANIKNAIKDNFNPKMDEDIVANDYIEFIKKVEGVRYVKNIKVSKNGLDWLDIIEISDLEKGAIGEINVTE